MYKNLNAEISTAPIQQWHLNVWIILFIKKENTNKTQLKLIQISINQHKENRHNSQKSKSVTCVLTRSG